MSFETPGHCAAATTGADRGGTAPAAAVAEDEIGGRMSRRVLALASVAAARHTAATDDAAGHNCTACCSFAVAHSLSTPGSLPSCR